MPDVTHIEHPVSKFSTGSIKTVAGSRISKLGWRVSGLSLRSGDCIKLDTGLNISSEYTRVSKSRLKLHPRPEFSSGGFFRLGVRPKDEGNQD
jgi:hypothetical protein